MADPNMQDFYGRVARIERDRARGFGFEAPGTLGLSYYYKPRRRHVPIVGPLLMLLLIGICLKGAIHYKVGDATYAQRVEALQTGEGFDRLGGVLMQIDPASLWVSNFIRDSVK